MVTIEPCRACIDELTAFYDNLDSQNAYLRPLMEKTFNEHQSEHPEQIKAALMQTLASESAVHVFREYPFWYQFSAARPRKSWGGLGAGDGGLYMYQRLGGKAAAEYGACFNEDRQSGKIHNWNNPVGLDHHALNYDSILSLGLNGLKQRAMSYRENATEEKLPFYNAAIQSLDTLMMLSERFAAEAERLAETATEKSDIGYYRDFAKNARKIPANPAETFYEALAAIVFCREAVGTLEGIGVSTYGHLDRMLYPYYKADLEAGRITHDEALLYIEKLLCYTAVRFDENKAPGETSTTVILGGCDADGNTVYNAVTDLFIEAEQNVRVANVKYDCRISSAHPQKYIDGLIGLQLAGLNMVVFMNDDIYIPARVRHGQDIRDARLYVAGGCHEIVLGGTEVCTRADTWIGLPAILLDTLKRREYADFDELCHEAIADVQAYHEKVEALKNAFEVHWSEYDPMPLYSSMMTGCLESGKDLTAGGSKYASTALSMLAPATFIDSLWAVKAICFDGTFQNRKYSVAELLKITESNFEGNEPLRQFIINRIPKHFSGNDELDVFSAKILHELSGVSGRKNGRGGYYYPAFYPHDIFRPMGYRVPTTPDGRKQGFALSRGISPSEFLTGITPAHILRSVSKIDFTDYTDSFAVEMTLPKLDRENGSQILAGIIREFLKVGGPTLQFNLFDIDALREAQKKPDEHRDIMVRVCGYSFYFVNLSREQQDEVVTRAMRL